MCSLFLQLASVLLILSLDHLLPSGVSYGRLLDDLMALSTSPRKIVPLATGDEARPRNDYTGSSSTKRVFFCGVVVEGSENGRRLPEGAVPWLWGSRVMLMFRFPTEIQELVLSLGELLESESESNILSSKSASGLDESVSRMPSCCGSGIRFYRWYNHAYLGASKHGDRRSNAELCPLRKLPEQ